MTLFPTNAPSADHIPDAGKMATSEQHGDRTYCDGVIEGVWLGLRMAERAVALELREDPQTSDNAAYNFGVKGALDAVRAAAAHAIRQSKEP